MYEGFYEALPDSGAYLRRIGLSETEIKTDIEGLDSLVRAQLMNVAFDNLDVWGKGACPNLEVRALFDKIVLGRRGGYCFELNSLFEALLRALGFDSYKVIAHVMAGRKELGPPAHCAIICRIEGEKYFCDVGYGGAVPYGGLGLSGESRFDFHIEQEGLFYKLVNEKSGEAELWFKDVPAETVELIPLNFFISQSPTSPFRNEVHLNLRLPDGSVSLVDGELKYRSGEERWERRIEADELAEIMEHFFRIPSAGVVLREFGPFRGNNE